MLQSSFLLGQKSTLWEYKIVHTIFSFCVGCLHAGQRMGISLGPPVQTHVVRLVVPTQSRMFPEVLQLTSSHNVGAGN